MCLPPNFVPLSRRHAQGREAAEEFAAQVDACPSPGVDFWLSRLKLLLCQSPSPGGKTLEMVFERAVQGHGSTSVALWLLWMQYCSATNQAIGHLAWRATRELAGSFADDFSLAYNDLQSSHAFGQELVSTR